MQHLSQDAEHKINENRMQLESQVRRFFPYLHLLKLNIKLYYCFNYILFLFAVILFYRGNLESRSCRVPNYVHLSGGCGFDSWDWTNFSLNNSYEKGTIPSLQRKLSFCSIWLVYTEFFFLFFLFAWILWHFVQTHTSCISYPSFLSYAHGTQCWVETHARALMLQLPQPLFALLLLALLSSCFDLLVCWVGNS